MDGCRLPGSCSIRTPAAVVRRPKRSDPLGVGGTQQGLFYPERLGQRAAIDDPKASRRALDLMVAGALLVGGPRHNASPHHVHVHGDQMDVVARHDVIEHTEPVAQPILGKPEQEPPSMTLVGEMPDVAGR
jgi:hypothetical protein